MGSIRPPNRKNENEISVLVTGFGPFQRHTRNPSWLIASALPDTLPAVKGGKKIRLYVIPEPVKVAYAAVREQVPPLLFSAAGGEDSKMRANFDVVLHMGVSHAKGYYEMETRAFRDDYQTADVDGHTSAAGFASWKDEGAPEMLPIGFDAHQVLSDWKKNAKDADVRRSADAGRYLCEYILFTSLYEYHKNAPGTRPPVTFLHVPPDTEPELIETGRDAAVGLIKALVAHSPSNV